MKPSPALRSPTPALGALSMALALFASGPALADGRVQMPRDAPPAYAAECGACHTAYAPGLLPAASWRRIMAGLDRHYGSDASLETGDRDRIAAWLEANAGRGRRVVDAPPEDRITQSSWFRREHRRIDAAVWAHPSVGSAAQCAACHRGAAQGDFEEDDVSAPAGLPPSLQRSLRH
jgi:cytochrome c553